MNYFTLKEKIDGLDFFNRICINPMEGTDADEDGTPSPLTVRRYMRFAKSSPSLIWFEAVAVCHEGKASKRQLIMTAENLSGFKTLISEIKKRSPNTKIICQLTHSGRFSRPEGVSNPIKAFDDPYLEVKYPAHKDFKPVSDEYLDTIPEMFYKSAILAKEAGFDGVDIKACHRYIVSELLAAHMREGRYGGSFENRSRLVMDIFKKIVPLSDDTFILGTRLGVFDVIDYPYGFGVSKDDKEIADFSEPISLINSLSKLGLRIVNITMGTPYYNSFVNKPQKSEECHPEKAVERLLKGAEIIKKACPEVKLVSTGFSYIKQDAFERGNDMLKAGKADFIGFGRLAFAYEGFGADILNGGLDGTRCCISCNKCSELLRAGVTTGCIIFDKDIYLDIYRKNMKGE